MPSRKHFRFPLIKVYICRLNSPWITSNSNHSLYIQAVQSDETPALQY